MTVTQTIPTRVSPERTLNELLGRGPRVVDPKHRICSCNLCTGLEASLERPIGLLRRDQVRQLVDQSVGRPWSFLPALGFLAQDPLGDDESYSGALLNALLDPILNPVWEANPEAGEVVRRACARVAKRADDPDWDYARDARFAIKALKGHWPWVPPASLDRSERWAMPDPPADLSLAELIGRDSWYEQFRSSHELLARLRSARDTPLGELTREQLRLLIQEHEGLPWVLPQALHLVEEDPLELTARHPGGLLIALLDIRFAVVWRHNPELVTRLRQVLADLERAAVDPDPARAQAPLALLQRLEERKLYPWHPKPTG